MIEGAFGIYRGIYIVFCVKEYDLQKGKYLLKTDLKKSISSHHP
jgi:hypothetical protein